MNIFDRKINFDALFKFSHITPSTQQHLKKVYASFALCMFVAAAGAYVHVVTHFIQVRAVFSSSCCGINCIRKKLAQQGGVGLGPALDLCIAINPSILPTAFMGTAMIFTCFTLSALYARRRSYLFLGGSFLSSLPGILMSAMSLMLLSSLGNLFFGSVWLFQSGAFCCRHCVDLFLDFVTLFRKLMMILAMSEKVSTTRRGRTGS
ncbi:TMBIM6 [Cervus elaphus hippelaphus]|uniref:TMBIM6 n=1 Tax=Cervus elaphus hippelaphus TaxID=46360 RepID=A0A212DEH0_CEREH|nr:TMBIM6 [Cervus elaphus hippelaphus]